MAEMATKYGEYLNVSLVGFGSARKDFSTLQAMSDACNEADGLARAEFVYSARMAHTIGSALTSLTTSLTQTRTSLMGRTTRLEGDMRRVAAETDAGSVATWQYFKIVDHRVFTPRGRRLVFLPSLPPGALNGEDMEFEPEPPEYLAMNSSSCGQGAERIAFRCFLADEMSSDGYVHGAMVAKESNLVHHMREHKEFHKAFCETQSMASFLAAEFNRRVRATPGYNASTTPIITFLPCSVLVLEDNSVAGGLKGVLVEKMLDVKRFGWCKWNDNGGGIDGKRFHAPLDIEYELEMLDTTTTVARTNRVKFMVDDESDEVSDEDSDDEEDPNVASEDVKPEPSLLDGMKSEPSQLDGMTPEPSQPDGITPKDYLQAFSHFSHQFTNKKVLVCDLQGVYNTDTTPPTFELTDPAIHYHSKRGRRMVYGRTDKGVSGMQLFLTTHTCTDLCKLISLSKKDKQWHRLWHKHHDKMHPDADR